MLLGRGGEPASPYNAELWRDADFSARNLAVSLFFLLSVYVLLNREELAQRNKE